jgi:CubicO group peptidase (beta-lactamase class C family)
VIDPLTIVETVVGSHSPRGAFSVAVDLKSGRFSHAGGLWPSGRKATLQDNFYAASLSKQLTGASIALLERDGALAPDTPAECYLPKAGPWSKRVTVRHLLHHTGCLPTQGMLEATLGERNWTDQWVMAALLDYHLGKGHPGMAYAYSNAGYVVLARIIETLSEMPFSEFVANRILSPNKLSGLKFSSKAHEPVSEQWALLGQSLPLSTGDGGLWAQVGDFADWLVLQNRDAMGIEQTVTQPVRLSSNGLGDYGWGIGIRGSSSARTFIHGGSWQGASAKALRNPSLEMAIVVLGVDENDVATLSRQIVEAVQLP